MSSFRIVLNVEFLKLAIVLRRIGVEGTNSSEAVGAIWKWGTDKDSIHSLPRQTHLLPNGKISEAQKKSPIFCLNTIDKLIYGWLLILYSITGI